MRELNRRVCLFITAVFSAPLFAQGFTSPFGQDFVKINAGEFIMGNEDFELLKKEVEPARIENLKKELPPHKVRITRDFYLATTETTQSIWQEVMDEQPGKEERWQREDWARLPVTRVSWETVHEFIDRVNEMDEFYHYRLPTEAEWEYAARAGTSGLRPFEYDDMGKYAWYRESSGDKPMPVGSLKPNAWGLYDMIGNVWEWVEDSFERDYYKVSSLDDPRGPELSERKVMRGGSYHCTPERARVGIRGTFLEYKSMSVIGFRLAADRK